MTTVKHIKSNLLGFIGYDSYFSDTFFSATEMIESAMHAGYSLWESIYARTHIQTWILKYTINK